MTTSHAAQLIGVVLFDGFELLDVAGPLESFGRLPEHYEIVMVGPAAGPVASAQGPAFVASCAYADSPEVDLVLVPGGIGTRALADDTEFLDWLRGWGGAAPVLTTVCTGAGLVAATGLLDGRRATTNKRAWEWATAQGPNVEWVAQARWVHDDDVWTSAGVAAGMDMALAIIAEQCGESVATDVANGIEYEWHRDAGWDPFAALNGLVGD